MNCPICGIEMLEVRNIYLLVMDGNFVYQCQNNTDHRFWKWPMQSNVIFQNPNASETSFDAIAGWKYTINPLVFTKMDKTELSKYVNID